VGGDERGQCGGVGNESVEGHVGGTCSDCDVDAEVVARGELSDVGDEIVVLVDEEHFVPYLLQPARA
jgi:hypothetical protein